MSFNEELSLPQDTVIEILSRLPPENLVRCRSVCKLWYSMIVDPNFISKHRENAKNGRIAIVKETIPADTSPATLKFRLFPDENPGPIPRNMETIDNYEDCENWKVKDIWRVEGTCNGLFCYVGFWENDPVSIFLCNPSIGWTTLLPKCPFVLENNQNSFQRRRQSPELNFDYGLGFDPIERDYKVLQIRLAGPHQPGEAAIFSLKSKSWKKVESPVPEKTTFRRSVFLHRSIHWLSHQWHWNYRTNTSIMLFDVHKETFGEIQLPEIVKNSVSSISVVRGSLCAMIIHKEGKRLTCRVWSMREYGIVESWTEQFKVVLPYEIERCLELTIGGKILCSSYEGVARDGKLVHEDGSLISGPLPQQLVLYDPQTGEYANVCRVLLDHNVFSIEGSLELYNSDAI